MSAFPVDDISRRRIPLVVGDVMLDRYWFGEVDRVSPEAPVPIVRVARREDRLGGAANVARNVVALGGQATLIGVVGADEAGERIHALAHDAGIAPALVRRCGPSHHAEDARTGPPAAACCAWTSRNPRGSPPWGCIGRGVRTASGRPWRGGGVGPCQGRAGARAAAHPPAPAEAGIPVPGGSKGDHYDIYRGATLVTPNRSEMQQAVGRWTSEDDLAGRAQRLRADLALEALLVTRSEQGMTVLFTDAGRDATWMHRRTRSSTSPARAIPLLATLAVTRAVGMPWPQSHALGQPRRRRGGRQAGNIHRQRKGVGRPIMIVVTGAAGFIGSNLVRGLNRRGIQDIIAVDDLSDGDKFVNLADCRIADYVDKDYAHASW